MPELPEVETIRRQLLPLYQEERICQIIIKKPELLKNATPELFNDALSGKMVENIDRFSKYLIFCCQGLYPVFHLGMSGVFLVDKSKSRYPQHIHIELLFESGKALYYQDIRRFGKVWLYQSYPEFPKVGIDPITGKLSLAYFKERLKSQNMNIKLFLMDQSIICGIGNIYASEMLFKAGISPYRKTAELNPQECLTLYEAMLFTLKSAIEKFGTSYSAYQTVTGQKGENQYFLKVYQRENQTCSRCGDMIQKAVLGSRSTFFCKSCQH